MEKFEKIYNIIHKLESPIIGIVVLLTGFIRYLVCKSFQCALGYALTAAFITLIVFTVFNLIGKRLLSSRQARGEDEDIEKSDKEVKK